MLATRKRKGIVILKADAQNIWASFDCEIDIKQRLGGMVDEEVLGQMTKKGYIIMKYRIVRDVNHSPFHQCLNVDSYALFCPYTCACTS